MQNTKYTHNKWFIGVIAILILWTILLGNTGNPDDQWGMLGLIMLAFGLLLFWPIDYHIHKKTVKEFGGKPVKIDPNFARKRNAILILLVVGSIAWISGGIIFGD